MDTMLNSMTKVYKCINTSNTIEQLETTRKLMDNFFKLYTDDIDLLQQAEMKSRLDRKYKELSNGVHHYEN